MSQQWHFRQNEQQQWHWVRVDASEPPVASSTTFESHTRCVLDAVRFAVQRRRAQCALDGDASGPQH